MNNIFRTTSVWATICALMLLLGGNAHAALVSYEIIGDVVLGEDNSGPNAFGLNENDTISATGVFDDSVLDINGDGTISFGSGSGNTMTITVGTGTYTASDDIDFAAGGDPFITLSSFTTLDDFDFLAFDYSFSSFFTSFDDFGNMFGDWRTTITTQPVPVPAAVWLFGSGLLGLVGLARKGKKA